mmetsp:Transcript_99480/g.315756  ORF Transcript_99480/g.315756 Transcript_99480/m.315756 type:complete len:259 (+) Transcript_99480:857-1633(+)
MARPSTTAAPSFRGPAASPPSPHPRRRERDGRDMLGLIFELLGTPGEAARQLLDRRDARSYVPGSSWPGSRGALPLGRQPGHRHPGAHAALRCARADQRRGGSRARIIRRHARRGGGDSGGRSHSGPGLRARGEPRRALPAAPLRPGGPLVQRPGAVGGGRWGCRRWCIGPWVGFLRAHVQAPCWCTSWCACEGAHAHLQEHSHAECAAQGSDGCHWHFKDVFEEQGWCGPPLARCRAPACTASIRLVPAEQRSAAHS